MQNRSRLTHSASYGVLDTVFVFNSQLFYMFSCEMHAVHPCWVEESGCSRRSDSLYELRQMLLT